MLHLLITCFLKPWGPGLGGATPRHPDPSLALLFHPRDSWPGGVQPGDPLPIPEIDVQDRRVPGYRLGPWWRLQEVGHLRRPKKDEEGSGAVHQQGRPEPNRPAEACPMRVPGV